MKAGDMPTARSLERRGAFTLAPAWRHSASLPLRPPSEAQVLLRCQKNYGIHGGARIDPDGARGRIRLGPLVTIDAAV